MKRILFFILIFLNLVPGLKNHKLALSGPQKVYAIGGEDDGGEDDDWWDDDDDNPGGGGNGDGGGTGDGGTLDPVEIIGTPPDDPGAGGGNDPDPDPDPDPDIPDPWDDDEDLNDPDDDVDDFKGTDPTNIIPANKFESFLQLARAAGVVVQPSYSTSVVVNGVTYTGTVTELWKNIDGEWKLIACYFFPDTSTTTFPSGSYYNIGIDNSGEPIVTSDPDLYPPYIPGNSPGYNVDPGTGGNPGGGDPGGGGNGTLPVTAAYLVNALNISSSDTAVMAYIIDPANELALEDIKAFLLANGNVGYYEDFVKWAIEFLYNNPSFDYHIFFDVDEFDGINNQPTNVSPEELIENGIQITEVASGAPENQNRIIGQMSPRHGSDPEDMRYGTNGDTFGIFPSQINLSTQTLFENMRTLLWGTAAISPEMRTVTSLMADRFENNIGGTFENSTLNQHVKQSVQFQNFLRIFGSKLSVELTKVNGDISQVSAMDTHDYRPIFNGRYNLVTGLQIAINDTESNEIRLLNFKTEGGVLWSADVEVTIMDHFGLDKNDALKYQSKHRGFAAWWLLQHTRGYKPFKTKIVIKSSIGGRY